LKNAELRFGSSGKRADTAINTRLIVGPVDFRLSPSSKRGFARHRRIE